MDEIQTLKSLSEKLINSITILPKKVEILSSSWHNNADDLTLTDFQLDSSVIHKFYIEKDSVEKLYVFWDHENTDKELKEFLKILIRVLKFSGTTDILALDECFSLSDFKSEIVGITDHINFTSDNPLIGKNFDEIGTRFPDMSHAYSDNYSARFASVRKVVLAGVDDLNFSDRVVNLIKQSEAEVYNFSVMWMNILAVHSSISFSAVCRVKSKD